METLKLVAWYASLASVPVIMIIAGSFARDKRWQQAITAAASAIALAVILITDRM
ncbi:hypothetical protein WHT83_07810 [Aminobacter sp. P9b]|uniref:Uncharacterized protein n=1 Tax=Aminobacter niigataensis TaxID=83265 RepID=A0ABR6L7W3_9HYPH|nr:MULTISPECIES: hypothetical protein [Aminobacter]AWC20602.1 hypothetical protein CO731_00042 [Aminobacter sp. MSH1]MBB4652693.1 hypothetical protein [Aminobacter niigataensis]